MNDCSYVYLNIYYRDCQGENTLFERKGKGFMKFKKMLCLGLAAFAAIYPFQRKPKGVILFL